MTGSAKQSIVRHKERMDCFASLAMTAVIDAPSTAATADMISRSRDMNCPRFASSFALLENRGRREDRVRAAPAVSCATCTEEHAHEHTGPAESIRPSLRNGFNGLLRALPGARIPFATVISGLMDGPTRSGRQILRRLDTSNGCQDHTTWPYAARPTPKASTGLVPICRSLARAVQHRSSACRPFAHEALKELRPATTFARPTLPRPPHPIPRFVTIAKRPSWGTGWLEYEGDLGQRRNEKLCGESQKRTRQRNRTTA